MRVQLTALPEEDQWIVVKALALSGLPDWQESNAATAKAPSLGAPD
jgi:hypothetical protein